MKKICLSIETTGKNLGLSLVQFDKSGHQKVLKQLFEKKPMQQSELLFPRLTKILKQKKIKKNKIDCIGVDIGPGSFTGVRVGVAAARALGQSLKKPVVGISSLEAVAYQNMKNNPIVVCFPALSGEVYFAAYKKTNKSFPLTSIIRPKWSTTKSFLSILKKRKYSTVIGPKSNDLKGHTTSLKKLKWIHTQCDPHPNSVAALAVCRFNEKKKGPGFSFRQTTPLYLQPSWAERRAR